MAKNCPGWLAWVTLVAGVLYLLADLAIWPGWNAINWWTVAFVLLGLWGISMK